MGGFLKFEKMITPFIIQLIFWLGVIGSIIGGLGTIVFGLMADSGVLLQVITGLLMMFIGPIVIRIYCELLMVIFSMQRALISIRDSVATPHHPVREDEVM